ncbi:DegT/DnrJ/EryC1/StrS family aminotransferase [Methylobacillus flagellatus]|uniref:DegT/DnrJ/EryC1/StrS family aminotransferase n=1 Tax=Methylobacillus flagellatus TaxID=405 RepID=UPI002853F600|nr:DegT/DnrJ/EryC1/StrS family aminotransferase [Methylobacillus flagellatus]MDR5172020.1 DegT/DnrJ/EryC1/StrS family aminotransferase [Methylobacillus flagellatus]
MSQHAAIPLLTPLLPDREALAPYLAKLDQNRHYSNFGPLNNALEARLAGMFEEHGAYPLHVTTTSSATLGLELALSSLDLPAGSKVIVPALTFVASLTAIIRAGYIPVIADIDAQSWLLTPEIATEAAIQTGARAVLAVAAFGQPQDTRHWSDFQRKSGIHVVIDAAGAFGSQWVEAPDIPVVYSMHATKSLAAGEGGLVVSGNSVINAHIRQLSNFGINLDSNAGFPVGHLSFVGSNAKLSEYHAAVAHASLDQWDAQARLRQDIYRAYRQALEDACGDLLQWQAGITLAAPTIFCLRMAAEARDRLETICRQRQIATRRWYQPLLHQHAAKVAPIIKQPTPVAEAVASGLIGLPFSPFLTGEDIARVTKAASLATASLTLTHQA